MTTGPDKIRQTAIDESAKWYTEPHSTGNLGQSSKEIHPVLEDVVALNTYYTYDTPTCTNRDVLIAQDVHGKLYEIKRDQVSGNMRAVAIRTW
jgi:hypothetical protein